jgi:predicted methyltransferase
MGFLSILSYTRTCVEERVKEGDIVIDATVGNGNDTEFLAQLVGETGCVFGFDIQENALYSTRSRLERTELLGRVTLWQKSHSRMVESLPSNLCEKVSAVMFNLGYLPGNDHQLVTTPDTTLPALISSLYLLKKGGIITIVLYTGHPGGQEEADSVLDWVRQLDQARYHVLRYQFFNQKNNPPFLLAIEKR